MILVADSGSTKTNWCLLQREQDAYYFDTEGYNPYFVSVEYIVASLTAKLPAPVTPSQVSHIYFYGAGCFDDKTHIIKTALAKQIFTNG